MSELYNKPMQSGKVINISERLQKWETTQLGNVCIHASSHGNIRIKVGDKFIDLNFSEAAVLSDNLGNILRSGMGV